MKNAWVVLSIINWSLLVLHPIAVHGATFTLSDSALMSLDYDFPFHGMQPEITGITDVAGPGVQFDILYSDPRYIRDQMPNVSWTSCIYGGNGSLTGIDISPFDAFALKFTLLSASGVTVPDAIGPIIVGSLIDISGSFGFHPEVIEGSSFPISVTSTTTTDADQITIIGFTCYIPYWWYDPPGQSPWDPDGATISLLVESAPGAEAIIPEPATLLLLGLGGLALLRKRRT